MYELRMGTKQLLLRLVLRHSGGNGIHETDLFSFGKSFRLLPEFPALA
jgi:hypothetical protein